jgi:hypothetical protein
MSFVEAEMISNMYSKRICVILILLLASISSVFSQKDKDKTIPPDAKPVLWKEPTDIASRDLFLGPGGEEMKPDVSQITFMKDDQNGYSVKYHVKDAAGKKWVVKVGNEARPETTANRLLWAIGYATEIDYVVPCVKIPNAPKPRKGVPRCEQDGFADVRFEARPDDVQRLDNWAWKKNPFAGTKELNGLIVIMALLNNWDLKDVNNQMLLVKNESGESELRYIISDLGATFGKTGGFISHSRNEPEKFVKTKFIDGVEGGHVRFAFSGKQGDLLDKITVADAKWLGNLLSQLTDQQLQDAFRAGDFKPEEINILVPVLRDRINQLVNLG